MGASELYPLVEAKIDVLLADWKNACLGAETAILDVANVLDDASVRAREARIMMLRERAIMLSWSVAVSRGRAMATAVQQQDPMGLS